MLNEPGLSIAPIHAEMPRAMLIKDPVAGFGFDSLVGFEFALHANEALSIGA
jgi:hypothetical protein